MTEDYLEMLRALLADLEEQVADQAAAVKYLEMLQALRKGSEDQVANQATALKLLEDQRFVTSVLIYLLEKSNSTPANDV